MTHDEALEAAVLGDRVRAATMLAGQYVEHSFSRGFLRCWPVDTVEEEPRRTQCDYRASAEEEAAEWSIVERPKVDTWGKPIDAAFFASLNAEREAPEAEVKPQRSKWGKTSSDAALIAIEQQRAKNPPALDPAAWGTPAPAPAARDSWGRPLT